MNVAYPKEMRPPKELFSREWFDIWNDYRPSPTYDRIDETKRKLEDLEVKLRKKIWKSGGYTQDLLVDTVTLLNTYIGVWQTNIVFAEWEIQMVYPHNKRVMSNWEEVVLGGVQRKGVCLSMLSSECVEWLNGLCHWVSE